MNGRLYPPGERTANDVYARTGVVVRAFAESEGDDEKYFDSLTRILPELIELYDHIYCSLSEVDPTYPWADGKFDSEKPCKRVPVTTPFLAKPCASKVATAFLWPIYSAFRTLLVVQADGSLKFKTDPIGLFDEMRLWGEPTRRSAGRRGAGVCSTTPAGYRNRASGSVSPR